MCYALIRFEFDGGGDNLPTQHEIGTHGRCNSICTGLTCEDWISRSIASVEPIGLIALCRSYYYMRMPLLPRHKAPRGATLYTVLLLNNINMTINL